jgi:hypothetical protein
MNSKSCSTMAAWNCDDTLAVTAEKVNADNVIKVWNPNDGLLLFEFKVRMTVPRNNKTKSSRIIISRVVFFY